MILIFQLSQIKINLLILWENTTGIQMEKGYTINTLYFNNLDINNINYQMKRKTCFEEKQKVEKIKSRMFKGKIFRVGIVKERSQALIP